MAVAGERRERAAREHAEAITLARDEMLAAVSHDLKSPLQTIKLASDLLARDLDASQLGLLGKIRRATARLEKLAGDLIDTSTLDAGALRLTLVPCDLGEMAQATIGDHELSADQKGVHLRCEDCPAGLVTEGDAGRLAQILDNLVSNAVKFTPTGGRVDVSVGGDASTVFFCVRDTGPGLRPDELANVFKRRWQAESSAKVGSGLGLFIARGLVEAHGGRIIAESRVGRGTTFRVELPRM